MWENAFIIELGLERRQSIPPLVVASYKPLTGQQKKLAPTPSRIVNGTMPPLSGDRGEYFPETKRERAFLLPKDYFDDRNNLF
jgi:hypothetical protein